MRLHMHMEVVVKDECVQFVLRSFHSVFALQPPLASTSPAFCAFSRERTPWQLFRAITQENLCSQEDLC